MAFFGNVQGKPRTWIAAGFGAALVGLAASSASAADWPSSGYFDIAEFEKSCGAGGEFQFEGRADVFFLADFDGEAFHLAFTSADWTRPADGVEMSYTFVGKSTYTGPAVGVSIQGRAGFTSRLDLTAMDDFAQASSLIVHRGETVVTHINLRGSSGAVATLRRCANAVRRQNALRAERERRFDYIAPDPFAGAGADSLEPLVITGDPNVPRDDYPERALSRGISGSATVECTVSATRRLTNCSVTSESPAGMGFGNVAARIAQRWRTEDREGLSEGRKVIFTQRYSAPP